MKVSNMALKPVLKMKVDELFLRWLSESGTQQILESSLNAISKGQDPDVDSVPAYNVNNSNKGRTPISPRVRAGSTAAPPCSPSSTKSPSPRSPRRSHSNRCQSVKQTPARVNKEKEFPVREVPVKTTQQTTLTDNNHADKDSFLRKKEAELRQKREREKKRESQDKVRPTQENKQDFISLQQAVEQQRGQHVSEHIRVETADKSQIPIIPPDASARIPKFYFPFGRPSTNEVKDSQTQLLTEVFAKLEGEKASKKDMAAVAQACGFPMYWKGLLYGVFQGDKLEHVTLQAFLSHWKKLNESCHDEAAKFVRLLAKPDCNYLESDDFVPLIQDVVDTHPGLTFLLEAPEFHSRYIHTVISRIFYTVNRSWTGRITISEIRKSNFLQTLAALEHEEDINNITDYFSYEHFYVIYCKFWELDKDHDLFISKEDLGKHNDHAISSKIIDRIFSGAVTRGRAQKEGKMSYAEFVWFLISEEDKKHPTSIEYWFRCMDLDGDGVLSMYELEYFYLEQIQKMESMGIETLPFEDCLCQMLDMVMPDDEGKITLGDLKRCKMTPIFFDTFFNIEKYLDHEQRDPFSNLRDNDPEELERSDWDRYAAEEYEILVAEEGAADAQLEELNYEDDFEDDEVPTLPSTDTGQTVQTKKNTDPAETPVTKKTPKNSSTDDDIYDFSTDNLGY